MTITVKEAAKSLQLSPQRVRSLLRAGKLEGRLVGRQWLMDPEAVNRFMEFKSSNVNPTDHPRIPAELPQLKALSFFSGAMGLDLGLERAGIEIILACEFDRASRTTIEANRPGMALLGDIWQYSAADIRKAARLSSNDDIELVVGGPPCQAFSTAGARRSFHDGRGNVFLKFIEIILELKPRYAVIENVRGLMSAPLKHRPHSERGDGKPLLNSEEMPGGALLYIVEALREAGYGVSFNLYNAANYGAPQSRERIIIICHRGGDKVPYLTPTHAKDESLGLLPWNSFRNAVAGLAKVVHHHVNFPENRLRFYRRLGPGQYWKHLPVELQKEALGKSYYAGGGKTGFFRRLAWDKPSPTLVTHPAMPATDLAHPEEDRPLSIEEYKRLQELPDSWSVAGSLTDQYKQVGNAVPVSLGAAVGRAIIDHMAGKTTETFTDFPFSRYKGTDDITWEQQTLSKLQSGQKQKVTQLALKFAVTP